ncbi:DUF2163 domain-containing protein [Sphingomonas paeninsulae]|uniref:DUF2163 domain-containing protein n=1 Tax=Sphingomonas paeninsulae TaxID=2319844 RepID=A0A494TK55_SPHPE|nr:DUF2163 domain-containing protein [Sphingomonas paeninsulae]AYJ86206.1 DUF2163 domain-containing protein [Sphingomonas paeninsulae]
MKTISAPLTALFNSGAQFYKADFYTWSFADGSVLRTTNADVALTFGGFAFASCAPICTRSKVTLKIGVEVDSMQVTVSPTATDMLSGLPWPQAARQGYLDGGTLLVETAYLTTWPTVIGTIPIFQGQLSDVVPSRSEIAVTVKSALELLSQNFPRNVYQSVCDHTVYDAGCTLTKSTYSFGSSVTGSPASTTTFLDTGLTQAAGYFDQGVLTFLSGALAGIKRTVKAYDGAGGFTFALPLPSIPATGVTISVFAGCDRTKATCLSKFANTIHFRGTPYVPTPESVRSN